MEIKKSPQADIEQVRTTGFLLGLILVLALLYTTLEWNSAESATDFDPIDLSELTHESELVPMSNEAVVKQYEAPQERQPEAAEQLRIVDDDVEMTDMDDKALASDDDETLLSELDDETDKPIQAMETDPTNPLNFRIVEDLPQFPGGAVEFMKWLTRNLRYPAAAQRKKTEGKVVAVFYVEKDGSITNISLTRHLSPECDNEALRVLRMMPPWKPGIQNNEPCRTKVQIPIVFKL